MIGLDTETQNGYCVLMCTPTQCQIVKDWDDVVDFFNNTRKRFAGWNVKFDVEGMFKYLPFDKMSELYKSGKTIIDDIEIKYPTAKLISINNHRFYDIMQFFHTSLDKAAHDYLGLEKIDNQTVHNWKNHPLWKDQKITEELIKYCQYDAMLTQKLGNLILETTDKLFGFKPKSLISTAKLSERLTLNYVGGLFGYPRYKPESEAGHMAYKSYHGGIFETWKRGTFYDVTDLDISSAYPSFMVNLPHWANGKFKRTYSPKEEDKYGWGIVVFDCPYIPWSRDLFNGLEEGKAYEIWNDEIYGVECTGKSNVSKKFYPVGLRAQYITLDEYRFMKKYGYKADWEEGYVWEKNSEKYPEPFGWINECYEKKLKAKDGTMDYLLLKTAMNAAYGKTAQIIGKPKLQNFYYASLITAGTRVQVLEFIKDNKLEDKVINIATDGLLIQGNINLTEKNGLGSWKKKHWDEALVIGNGIYQLIRGIGYEDFTTKARGITESKSLNLKDLIQRNRNKESVRIYKKRPIHLGEALIHKHVLTPKDINVFTRIGRKLSANSDDKQHWPYLVLGDLLDNQYTGKRWTVEELDLRFMNKKLTECERNGNIRDIS